MAHRDPDAKHLMPGTGLKPPRQIGLWFRVIPSRLRAVFQREQLDRELSAEVQSHLEMLTEENLRKGMNPEEARMMAKKEFGGVEHTKETYRDQRGLPFLEILLQYLRYGLRGLLKKPSFPLVAVLTLAMGIGVTSAVFSAVDRILFRSLPYPDQERLVSFGFKAPIESAQFMRGTDYRIWRAQQTPFESMTTLTPGGPTGAGDCDLTDHNPTRLNCAYVESNFLPTFRIKPILGHNFSREEDRPNAPRVVMLSYGLWRSRFAGDPGITGKCISLDGQRAAIIGVLPADFEMPNLAPADIVLPQALDESRQQHPNAGRPLRAFARLKPGVSPAQATAALQPLFQKSLNFIPRQFRKEVSLVVRSLRDRQVQDARLASWILLGAVLAVLMVACTNVANLLLARATSRRREGAVRAALGASRWRLIRQTLTESLLLGLLGGVTGFGVAYFMLRLFVSIAPEGILRLHQARLDFRVLLFTLGVSLTSGMLFGVAAALRKPSPELLSGRDVQMTARSILRQTLVVAQIAVSLVLLAGAGLLLRSLWNLENTPIGMHADNVLIAKIVLGDSRGLKPEQQLAFFQELEKRLRRLPGVTALALSDTLPPAGVMRSTIYALMEVAGRPRMAEGTGGMVGWRSVTPEYFSALGIAIVRGRGFREEDLQPNQNPVILSDALARQLFVDQDPVGKTMRFGNSGPWRTVVGVAGNVKNNGLAVPAEPEFYIPWKHNPQTSFRAATVCLRSPLNPRVLAGWVRSEAAGLDPTLPVEMETMTQRVGKLAQRPKFNAVLLSLFAGMGMLLAGIGIYGVVASLVAQRAKEIGVRMALGASPLSILKMVLSHVARWTLLGALLGLLGTFYVTRLLNSLLFQVGIHDPRLLGAAVALLLAVAFVAAWIPARRAMRVDPVVALRYE